MPRLITRKKFLRCFAGCALGGVAAGSYARWGETHWLRVTRTAIALPKRGRVAGAAPLRILHLSDLHAYEPWVSLDHIARAVALGLAQKPDLVCLTGDFITRRYGSFGEYARILHRLAVAAPTFACLGNHDGGIWSANDGGYSQVESVQGMLAAAGIDLLYNSYRDTVVKGHHLQLFGVGDWWSDRCRPGRAFAGVPPREGALRLVLNHNPDAKVAFATYDWDLMLCGHTHGGQIGIPGIAEAIAPVQDKDFIAGLYRWQERQIFITRGVGNLHGVRFLCPPEVSVLEVA
jgi:predicted MPP superfamily phosphohydrolase